MKKSQRSAMSWISLLLLATALSSMYLLPKNDIPRTWDEEAIEALMLPLADTAVEVVPISADYYYQLPERHLYKTYPIRLLDSLDQARYLDSLRQLDPVEYDPDPQSLSEEELIALGEKVFHMPVVFFPWPPGIMQVLKQDIEENGVRVTEKGVFPFMEYVIAEKGEVLGGTFSCAECHTRVMDNGMVIKGAQGNSPFDHIGGISLEEQLESLPDSLRARLDQNVRNGRKSLQRAPWINHPSQTELDNITAAEVAAYLKAIPPGVVIRHGTNFKQPANIPDLIGIKNRKYLDQTGLMRHRSIGDLMRYSAFNQLADQLTAYNGFIPDGIDFKTLPEPGTGSPQSGKRYSELQLFALAKYLYSLEYPKNPETYDPSVVARGEQVFLREGCVTCHTPPEYTNNMLTPVDGFTPPKEHLEKYDIFDISLGTDPGLALYTRRGTGYYKVPSLRGLWYRGPLGHSGHIATLEDWFDPARLEDDYVPTGFKPPFVETMAVPGHELGMDLQAEDKAALITFLKTI